MIKRIFTLLAGFTLLLGVMTASAASEVSLLKLVEGANKGFYQLKVGPNGEQGVLAVKDLAGHLSLVVYDNESAKAHFENTLWCVTVTKENKGKAPIFDFINKGAQVSLDISMDVFDKPDVTHPDQSVFFPLGGEISGWANSPTFAEGVTTEKPMYSYFTTDSVVGIKITEEVLNNPAQMAAGGFVGLKKASANEINEAGFDLITISAVTPFVLTADQINKKLGADDLNGIKLTFTPDKNNTKLANPFSDFKFKATQVTDAGDEAYVNVINMYSSPAKDSLLYVDKSYINASGSKFLAFKHTADAAGFKTSKVKDYGKFLFVYHPSTDEVTIQAKTVDYGTGKTTWEAEKEQTIAESFLPGIYFSPDGKYNYVGVQDISTADAVRVITISPDPITAKIYLGVPSCGASSNMTSLADSVYTIQNAKGQYLAVPIYNCERNDEAASFGIETITGPTWVDVNPAEQNVEDMPAYQWVVLKDKTNPYFANSSSVTITNREYPELSTSVQLKKIANAAGDTIVVVPSIGNSSSELGTLTTMALYTESNLVSLDPGLKGLTFTGLTNLSDSKIGYKTLSEKELAYNTALYSLKYFNPYTMDKYVAMNDTILTAMGDSTATFRIGLPIEDTKINAPYGFEVTDAVKARIPSLVNLVRTPYILTASNGNQVGQANDMSDIESGGYNKVTVSEWSKHTPFFFKENNHYNGNHYYAMVVAHLSSLDAPYTYTPNCVKVGVADNTLNAALEYQCGCERRTSSFAIEVTDLALYRHFINKNLGEVEGRDTFKFVEKVRGEYLMDENNVNLQNKKWEADNNHTIDYLGIWTADKASLNGTALGLQLDTVWVNRGLGLIKPQYLISVAHHDVAAADTIPCTESTPHHDIHGNVTDALHCAHAIPGHAGFDYGKYLISFADSTWNIPYTDVENGYYRLAFKPAIHITDTLILLDSDDQLIAPDSLSPAALIAKYKASGYKAKVKGGYVLPLTGDQHKNYTWSFRYTNPGKGATTTTEGVDNEFLIESNVFPYGDKAQAIAPEHAGLVKMQNGCLCLTNSSSEFNSAKTGGDGALIFNVKKMTAGDAMVTDAAAVTDNNVTIIAGIGQITINGAAGKKVVVSNILGQTVANTVLSSDNATISAPAGVVVVAVEGEAAVKAIVK
jgi:hypothetical protein